MVPDIEHDGYLCHSSNCISKQTLNTDHSVCKSFYRVLLRAGFNWTGDRLIEQTKMACDIAEYK